MASTLIFFSKGFIGILIFAIIILISVKEEENYFVKILNFGPLVYLGSISYGIYMFHFLVIWSERQISKYILKIDPDGFMIIVTTVIFTILLAHISKIYLENKNKTPINPPSLIILVDSYSPNTNICPVNIFDKLLPKPIPFPKKENVDQTDCPVIMLGSPSNMSKILSLDD